MEAETSESQRTEDLHLDRIVASHPEIGPTPPDGGYGWLIVVSAVIYNLTVPTLTIVYGFVILKSLRDDDHVEGEAYKVWDVDIALVPVIMTVIRLLMESWCRAIIRLFNMPRFMALAGLCTTVAGVLLSSFTTRAEDNDVIVNVFAGIFVGAGCALTGQQTDVILTHYFRDKLTLAQRLVKMAPSIGNCFVPIFIGFLSKNYTGDIVVTIYGAVIMQNCFFLASFTRPVYIEKVIRHTYNMLRVVEDEDEVIFSNQNQANTTTVNPEIQAQPSATSQVDDNDDNIVVYKSKQNAKEVLDPAVQIEENAHRFSSDFSAMHFDTPNRFSSDFSSYSISGPATGYQELEDIDGEAQNPQPLYRETTVDAPANNLFVVSAEMTQGTARRTASVKKNLITLVNMLRDVNFYLYILLHLCTTFSMLILSVFFPPLVWERNPYMNVWSVAMLTAVVHGSALFFIVACLALPKSFNEKAKVCTVLCLTAALGFYGISITSNRSFLVVWGMFASFCTASSLILQQPLYNNFLNEFDTTATNAAANTIVATFIMIWAIARSYSYKTSFLIACILQVVTGCIFLASSFRRRR